jgi:hypothetical protein
LERRFPGSLARGGDHALEDGDTRAHHLRRAHVLGGHLEQQRGPVVFHRAIEKPVAEPRQVIEASGAEAESDQVSSVASLGNMDNRARSASLRKRPGIVGGSCLPDQGLVGLYSSPLSEDRTSPFGWHIIGPESPCRNAPVSRVSTSDPKLDM